jgi:hypothetical protein
MLRAMVRGVAEETTLESMSLAINSVVAVSQSRADEYVWARPSWSAGVKL